VFAGVITNFDAHFVKGKKNAMRHQRQGDKVCAPALSLSTVNPFLLLVGSLDVFMAVLASYITAFHSCHKYLNGTSL
jgi:hypothetical protein